MNNNEKILISVVQKTLDDVYINESYLLQMDSSERSIVFQFGRYFIKNLENYIEFRDYSVDYEYNREGYDIKQCKKVINKDEKQRIFPDIILHERGTNGNNIIAIEFKKSSNKVREKDYHKLCELTDSNYKFKYNVGLFIILSKKREKVVIEKFVNCKNVSQVFNNEISNSNE